MGHFRDVARRIAARFERPVRCGACRRARSDTVRLVSGPRTYLCEVCIHDSTARQLDLVAAGDAPASCDFCGELRPPAPLPPIADIVVCAVCLGRADTVLAEDDQHRRLSNPEDR